MILAERAVTGLGPAARRVVNMRCACCIQPTFVANPIMILITRSDDNKSQVAPLWSGLNRTQKGTHLGADSTGVPFPALAPVLRGDRATSIGFPFLRDAGRRWDCGAVAF